MGEDIPWNSPNLWVKRHGWQQWYQVSEMWDDRFSIVFTNEDGRVINDSFATYSIHSPGWQKKIVKEN